MPAYVSGGRYPPSNSAEKLVGISHPSSHTAHEPKCVRMALIFRFARRPLKRARRFIIEEDIGAGPLNKYSGQITQPETQGSSQAMLYATGMSEADMQKPQVGIASMWFEGNPCNMHLLGPGRRSEKGRHAKPASSACGSTRSASPTASRWAPTA